MSMKIRRVLAAAALAASVIGSTASVATAAPKKCPPGQTVTVEVLNNEVVETCRISKII
jgi:hypothetical protein